MRTTKAPPDTGGAFALPAAVTAISNGRPPLDRPTPATRAQAMGKNGMDQKRKKKKEKKKNKAGHDRT